MSISDLYNIKTAIARDKARSQNLLPFPSSRNSSRGALLTRLCNLCYTCQAKYACPKCNVPYCSLLCFRSKPHQTCASSFSLQSLRSELLPEEMATSEADRTKVIEMIRRMESGNDYGSEDETDSDHSEIENDIHQTNQLAKSVDMDTASEETLLSLLTEKQKKRFFQTIQDPKLAHQLLDKLDTNNTTETEGLITKALVISDFEPIPTLTPRWQVKQWWQIEPFSPFKTDQQDEDFADLFGQSIHRLVSQPSKSSIHLEYNLVTVLLVYVYILQHLNISSLASLFPPSTTLPSSDPMNSNDDQDDDEPPPLEPDVDSPIVDTKSDPLSASDPNPLVSLDYDAIFQSFHLFDSLVPFLTVIPTAKHTSQSTSTLVLSDLQQATHWFLSRLGTDRLSSSGNGSSSSAAQLCSHLLHQVDQLCQVENIVVESETDRMPKYRVASKIDSDSVRFSAWRHSLCLNAVADMAAFFYRLTHIFSNNDAAILSLLSSPSKTARSHYRNTCTAAQNKLAFYAVNAILLPQEHSDPIQSVRNQIVQLQSQIDQELKAQKQHQNSEAVNKVLSGGVLVQNPIHGSSSSSNLSILPPF